MDIKQKSNKADLFVLINNKNMYIKKNVFKKTDKTFVIYDIFLFKVNDYISSPEDKLEITGPLFNLTQNETLEINNNIIKRDNIIENEKSSYIIVIFYQKKGDTDDNIDIGITYYHPVISEKYNPLLEKNGYDILNEAFLKKKTTIVLVQRF